MFMKVRYLSLLALATLLACGGQDKKENSYSQPSQVVGSDVFDLYDIQQNGELIVLMLYGPGSYFEFKGSDFGVQYMLANEYAKSIGCRIRVEVSHNPQEMIEKLKKGEGDIIATAITADGSLSENLSFCGAKPLNHFLDSISVLFHDTSVKATEGAAWAVRSDATQLSASLNDWLTANQSHFKDYTTIRIKDSGGKTYSPRRNVKSPILNLAKGQISTFDVFFKKYSRQCGWDWKLLAAQSYQESGFDPNAVSYMGAMGLMQLMPATARNLGISQDRVFDPESNIHGATRLISQLNSHYSSIHNESERINFILAAYNAGPGHVDDARALAAKNGKDRNVWKDNVDYYILNMCKSEFYNQPEVKHGYFRGTETYDYVNSIRTRWDEYRSKVR